MLTLSEALLASLNAGELLVAADARRAAAVRLAHSIAQAARRRSVWRTPAVLSWTGWLEREVAAAGAGGGSWPRVMGETEAWLVWRSCALDTARSTGITASDALVEGLHRAAGLASQWLIPTAALARGAHLECAWLVRTLHAFEARCRDLGAAPLGELAARLERVASPRVALAGLDPPTPWQRARIERWLAAGSEIRSIRHADARAQVRVATAADGADELALAAEWARARLLEDPQRRLLVVMPQLSGMRAGVARAFARALEAPVFGERPAFAFEGGDPLANAPLVRHALTSLGSSFAAMDFDLLAAWLRAPYWDRPLAPARAQLELWLRDRLGVRVSFAGLMATLLSAPPPLAEAAAELHRRFDEAARVLAGAPARSSVWVERFVTALRALGFPGGTPGAPPAGAYVRLLEVLDEFAMLDVALGNLAHREALEWLERLVTRATFNAAAVDPAVTITDALTDPIVRYDGIWVTDVRAERWPAPVRRDPFIPAGAQVAAGVPGASAAAQLAHARATLAAWRAAAHELVLSSPLSADDCEQTPSTLVQELPDVRPYAPVMLAAAPAAALFASRTIEHFDDDEGASWPTGAPLPSGARSVEHQIRCGFRAYAELRLHAQRLEQPSAGLDARERGRLVHRALELTWSELRDSAGLAARGGDALDALIARCVGRGASELLAEAPGEERERALRREQRRVVRLVASLCALDSRRAPFSVTALEARRALEVEGARLNVRIDRIDRLEDGSLALIDYKSGAPRAQDWLGERPSHPQLLVYLRAIEGDVAALATAHLATGRVAFRGIADRPGRLPKVNAHASSPVPGAPDAWPRQLDAWRRLVDRAICDFVAGRAVRDPARGACELCHLHALCRIGDVAHARAGGDE